jgi:hypothetical protein
MMQSKYTRGCPRHDAEVVQRIGPVPLHVVPAVGTDQIQHELDENCVCGPQIELALRRDGSFAGSIVVHHSLDGREREGREVSDQ